MQNYTNYILLNKKIYLIILWKSNSIKINLLNIYRMATFGWYRLCRLRRGIVYCRQNKRSHKVQRISNFSRRSWERLDIASSSARSCSNRSTSCNRWRASSSFRYQTARCQGFYVRDIIERKFTKIWFQQYNYKLI